MKLSRLVVVALVVLCLSFCTSLFAQSDRGAIAGTVVDSTGAAVTGAKVTAVSVLTGEKRVTETTATGSFLLPELKANPWKVTVEATGFKTATTEVIQVAVQITQRVNINLEVGALSQTVTVEGVAPTIQTESAVTQTNVTERQVRELPLVVGAETAGRTPLAFIFLDSSVAAGTGLNDSQTNTSRFRVNGGQALGTSILMDGASTYRAQNGTFFTEVAPTPNAFQEFTMSTSSYSSEFGNSSGGVVNFTLKSGTNRLHGEVYDLLQNEKLNANSWLANHEKRPKDRDHQNDFGFNLGGPIYIPKMYDGRDKSFFFFNYGGYRFNKGENAYITVPTLKMRTGDFSELLTDPYVLSSASLIGHPVQIYNPRQPQVTRDAIPGNRLDLYQGGALLDPAGMAILNLYPNPTREGVYHNYLAQSTNPTTMNNYVFKLDHVLSEKQRISGSYSWREVKIIQGGFKRLPDPMVAAGVWDQVFRSQYARIQHDYTISPTMLNHLNIGWQRLWVANPNSTLGFDASSLGIPANASENAAFPRIGFPGYNGALDPRAAQDVGSTWWSDSIADNSLELSDSLTWVSGKHTFKMGGSLRWQQLNINQLIDPGGSYNFRHDQTARDNDRDGGWTLASLATGATEWSFITVTSTAPGWRYFTSSFFFNDDFKVTPRLTVNLGVRYEIPLPRTEMNDRYRAFDPNAINPITGTRGAIAGAAGQGGVKAQYEGMMAPDYTNFSPRFGFAYSLDSKTVVRGGIGLYYSPLMYGYDGGNDPASGIIGYRTSRIITPLYPNYMEPGAWLRTYPARVEPDPTGQFLGSDPEYFNRDAKSGRSEQWSLDLQRELPGNIGLTLGYIGSKGTRLRSGFQRMNAVPLEAMKLGTVILNKNINDLTAADRAYAQSVGISLPTNGAAVYAGFNGNVAQALKPFPQYNRIRTLMESDGQSWYHAMQMKFDKRFSQGFQFNASWTWSKLIATASEDLFGGSPLNGVLQNPYDSSQLRTVSANNPTHVLVFNYIAELPFGKGKKLLNDNRFLDKIVGGWQFSGIHRYQSGLPLTVSADQRGVLDMLGYYGNLRPNLTGQPLLTTYMLDGLNVQMLNPGAFAGPPDFNAPPTRNVSDPAYAAYYANPTAFFGNASPVLAGTRMLGYRSEDLSILKKTSITEGISTEVGVEFFNAFNRHRYATPDTWLGAWNPNTNSYSNRVFGLARVYEGNAYKPRIIQLRFRVTF